MSVGSSVTPITAEQAKMGHALLLRNVTSTAKGHDMADAQVALKLPVLRLGSAPESGPTVIQHLQLMLNERGGFPVVTVDGVFGPTTEQSVKHYQQNENLSVDGIVGKQTWTSLLSKWLLQSEAG
jgi:peptidoglycan hydrolase-like protein with peptidoglycan-binding domain